MTTRREMVWTLLGQRGTMRNADLAPLLGMTARGTQSALASLIRDGYVEMVSGGAGSHSTAYRALGTSAPRDMRGQMRASQENIRCARRHRERVSQPCLLAEVWGRR